MTLYIKKLAGDNVMTMTHNWSMWDAAVIFFFKSYKRHILWASSMLQGIIILQIFDRWYWSVWICRSNFFQAHRHGYGVSVAINLRKKGDFSCRESAVWVGGGGGGGGGYFYSKMLNQIQLATDVRYSLEWMPSLADCQHLLRSDKFPLTRNSS